MKYYIDLKISIHRYFHELTMKSHKQERDFLYLILLFVVYLLCFNTLFFSQKNKVIWDYDPSQQLYIYLLTPCVLFPFKISYGGKQGFFKFSIRLSMDNIIRNFRHSTTPFFILVLVFILSQAGITYYHNPNYLQFYILFFYFSVPLIIFFIATIRLSVEFPNFFYSFYFISGILVSINAGINLFLYMRNINTIQDIWANRIGSIYGFPFGNHPNVDGAIYSNFMCGVYVTFMSVKSNCRKILIPSLLILLVTFLLEQTRGEMIAVIIAFITYVSLQIQNYRKAIGIQFFIFIMMVSVFYIIFSPAGIGSIFHRMDSNRLIIWKYVFEHYIKESPFIGYGIGDNLFIPIPGWILLHAHSIPIGAFIRGGIIGVISIFAIYYFGLVNSYVYSRVTKNYVPLCVFISFVVEGFFDHELKIGQAGWELAAFWVPISLAVGADAVLRNE